jgi:hypothetical protein
MNFLRIGGAHDILTLIRHQLVQTDGTLIAGALGPDTGGLTIEEGYDAARTCGLNLIATLKKQLGDLDRVEQVVKVCYRCAMSAWPCQLEACVVCCPSFY